MKPPLYITGISDDGCKLVGGVFRMKDEMGYPIDMCHDECKQLGYHIDILELLCDCWLNDCLKFDQVLDELTMLGYNDVLRKFQIAGGTYIEKHGLTKALDPVNVFCKHILDTKKR